MPASIYICHLRHNKPLEFLRQEHKMWTHYRIRIHHLTFELDLVSNRIGLEPERTGHHEDNPRKHAEGVRATDKRPL